MHRPKGLLHPARRLGHHTVCSRCNYPTGSFKSGEKGSGGRHRCKGRAGTGSSSAGGWGLAGRGKVTQNPHGGCGSRRRRDALPPSVKPKGWTTGGWGGGCPGRRMSASGSPPAQRWGERGGEPEGGRVRPGGNFTRSPGPGWATRGRSCVLLPEASQLLLRTRDHHRRLSSLQPRSSLCFCLPPRCPSSPRFPSLPSPPSLPTSQ